MAKAPAEVRLARLLDIVPWIEGRDGPTLQEVSERFAIPETELVADLNLLFLCGVHPFTPDVLIDVDIAGGRVWIRMADYFRRPLRLSPQEALALASAAGGFLNLPDSDPQGSLATALSKLETVLGVGPDDGLEVQLDPAEPDLIGSLRTAVDQHRKVNLDYYSFGRDGRAQRVVRPWSLFNSSGHWYMRGWCERVGAERLFRLDRVMSATVLDERFDPPPVSDLAANTVFEASPSDTVVVVDLDPRAHWIAEQYPNDGIEELEHDVLRVSLRVSEQAWLDRVLLKAGPDARLVGADPALARAAAERLLRRYRS